METVSYIQCSDCGRAGDDVALSRRRGNLPYCPRCVKKCSLCHLDADSLGYLSDGKLRFYVCADCWNEEVQKLPRWLEHSSPPGRCDICQGPDPVAEFEHDDGSISLLCYDCGNTNAKRRRGRPAVFRQMRFRARGDGPSIDARRLLGRSDAKVTRCHRTTVNHRYLELFVDLFRPMDIDSLKRAPCAENLSWLLSDEALANGHRRTILIELGRALYQFGPEQTRQLAEKICKHKLKTWRSAAYIRAVRVASKSVS